MRRWVLLVLGPAMCATCTAGPSGGQVGGPAAPEASPEAVLAQQLEQLRAQSEADAMEAAAQAKASEAAATYMAKIEADRRQLKSQWSYWEKRDEMTDRPVLFASAGTTEPVEFGAPYGGPQYPNMTVRHSGRKVDVILQLERGQFMCSSWDGCAVTARFDDSPPERYSASPSADHDTTVLFINNASKFYGRARKASRFIVEAMVYQEGSPRFRFVPGPILATDNRPKRASP